MSRSSIGAAGYTVYCPRVTRVRCGSHALGAACTGSKSQTDCHPDDSESGRCLRHSLDYLACLAYLDDLGNRLFDYRSVVFHNYLRHCLFCHRAFYPHTFSRHSPSRLFAALEAALVPEY